MPTSQAGYYLGFIPRWNIFQMPFPQIFGFIIFMIAGFAETNRIPFDLPEAENELVAGFHTEYSSMKFACFFMSEYANMVTITCVATLLFLGGWHPLFPAPYSNWVPMLVFLFRGGVFASIRLRSRARKWDRVYVSSLRRRGALFWRSSWRFPLLQTYPGSYFLVRQQGRFPAFHLYLGSRHAAALPL